MAMQLAVQETQQTLVTKLGAVDRKLDQLLEQDHHHDK